MRITFAKYDMDTGYVIGKTDTGKLLLVEVSTCEDAFAKNMYQRSELDYLLYNDPASYVELIANSDVRRYLVDVTQSKQ